MARTKKSKPGKGQQSKSNPDAPKSDRPSASKTTTQDQSIKSTPINSNGRSPLDKLSGELRNLIWRDVLLSGTPILVSKENPHQPALLRTCVQIRKEATGIYFNENRFNLPMDGYDSTLGMKWCHIALPHLQDDQMSHLGWEREPGTKTWDDLKVWLLRTHLGQVPRYSPTYYSIDCDEDAEEMFDVLGEFAGQPWKKAEKALEKHKRSLESELELPLFDNPGSDC